MKFFLLSILFFTTLFGKASPTPNIVWIVIEDASPHVGCYGETLIKTPHIDSMAREGIRCKNAFVTSPVCSSSRSAMVSGMYQTTLGVHNHRSQTSSGKGGGNAAYYDSYKVPKSVKLIPELFREAERWRRFDESLLNDSETTKQKEKEETPFAEGTYVRGATSAACANLSLLLEYLGAPLGRRPPRGPGPAGRGAPRGAAGGPGSAFRG